MQSISDYQEVYIESLEERLHDPLRTLSRLPLQVMDLFTQVLHKYSGLEKGLEIHYKV